METITLINEMLSNLLILDYQDYLVACTMVRDMVEPICQNIYYLDNSPDAIEPLEEGKRI